MPEIGFLGSSFSSFEIVCLAGEERIIGIHWPTAQGNLQIDPSSVPEDLEINFYIRFQFSDICPESDILPYFAIDTNNHVVLPDSSVLSR